VFVVMKLQVVVLLWRSRDGLQDVNFGVAVAQRQLGRWRLLLERAGDPICQGKLQARALTGQSALGRAAWLLAGGRASCRWVLLAWACLKGDSLNLFPLVCQRGCRGSAHLRFQAAPHQSGCALSFDGSRVLARLNRCRCRCCLTSDWCVQLLRIHLDRCWVTCRAV